LISFTACCARCPGLQAVNVPAASSTMPIADQRVLFMHVVSVAATSPMSDFSTGWTSTRFSVGSLG
jgi:hypothetical protein